MTQQQLHKNTDRLMEMAFLGHLHYLSELVKQFAVESPNTLSAEKSYVTYSQITGVIKNNLSLWQYDFQYSFQDPPANADKIYLDQAGGLAHKKILEALSNLLTAIDTNLGDIAPLVKDFIYCLKKQATLQKELAFLAIDRFVTDPAQIPLIISDGKYFDRYYIMQDAYRLHQENSAHDYMDSDLVNKLEAPRFSIDFRLSHFGDPYIDFMVTLLHQARQFQDPKNPLTLNVTELFYENLAGVLASDKYSSNAVFTFIDALVNSRLIESAEERFVLGPLLLALAENPLADDKSKRFDPTMENLVNKITMSADRHCLGSDIGPEAPLRWKVDILFTIISTHLVRGHTIAPGIKLLSDLAAQGVDIFGPSNSEGQSLVDIAKNKLSYAGGDLLVRFDHELFMSTTELPNTIEDEQDSSLNNFRI